MYDLRETTDKIGSSMKARIDRFYQYLTTYGMLGLWRRSHNQYFAGFYSKGMMQDGGQDGELTELSVNDYRNLIQHLAILITASDIKWDVRSINTDKRSQLQSFLVPGLLEYYEKYGGARQEAFRCAEYCLVYGDGYMMVDWDRMKGENFDYEEVNGKSFGGEDVVVRRPIKTGDVCFKAVSPIDVIFDHSQKEFSKNNWVIVREFRSKFELAETYKEYRDEIEAMNYKYDFSRDLEEYTAFNKIGDTIQVFTLWHNQTPSMPLGRKTVMVGENLVVEDGILPYERIPLSRMNSGFLDRTPFGYSMAFDMLPLQRAQDILFSIIMSNQSMFGVQNILIPDGSGISKEEIERGMNIIKYPPGMQPPTALNLTQTPQEIPRMAESIGNHMELLSGVNSVTRGQPDQRITAGNAMALLQAQTIQFSSQLQASYTMMREEAAMNCLDILRKNLTVEKAIAISGKMPGQFINAFKAEDLDGIHRIVLDLGNPSTKTAIGRRAMADAMLQYGAIKDPEKYVQIATTGNLEVGTEDKVFENILLKDHEEKLLAGEMPIISWVDNHPRFLQMAVNLISTPEFREDPAKAELINEYIQAHIEESLNADPVKLAAIGRTPLIQGPPMVGPGAPPPPGGAPQDGPAPAGAAPKKAGEGAAKAAEPEPGIPAGTRMPTNPLTKEEWNPQTGG